MDKEIKNKINNQEASGAIYFFGLIGAIIYYVSTATSFWMGAIGVLKSFFWPGFLVFELLKFLNA